MMRDPCRHPQVGDVISFTSFSEGGRSVQHQYVVCSKRRQSIDVLNGNWDPYLGGREGGSPQRIPLAHWRKLAANGQVLVLGEEGFKEWDAIHVAWSRLSE